MEDKEIDKIYELIESEEFESAKEIIAGIIEKDSDDMEARKLLALCEVNLENYDLARVILEDVVKYKQDDALVWYYLGCCYDNLNDLIAAKHAYLKVLELRPEYIDAYKSLAIVYIKSEKFDEAIETGKKALEISGDVIQYIIFSELQVWQEITLKKVLNILKKRLNLILKTFSYIIIWVLLI